MTKNIQQEQLESENENSNAFSFQVLLVEDVPLIQKFSCNILETLGCTVTLANNAAEAIEYSKNHYDLIFMDIGLPDEDGVSVIRKIKRSQHNQNTPTIALTAQAATVRDECLAAGVDDLIDKPASYNTLLKCLARYNKRLNYN